MSWKQHGFFLAAFAIVCLVGLPSCGHNQQLSDISIQPATETFGAANIPVIADAGLSVQLRALGNYTHPPVTKDITDQVTWASNDTQMVTVSATGLLTAVGLSCGNSLVSATVTTNKSTGNLSSSGAIVTGYMTANVVCFTGTGPTLTVNFAGAGFGIVTSSPPGLSCAATCGTSFATGTTVALTATPTGSSTFGGWSGCDVVSGQVCTVNNLTSNRSVTATFN
jgi:Divergent InlB B-repeat domain/Bacterial Ig-like domain (group 2)